MSLSTLMKILAGVTAVSAGATVSSIVSTEGLITGPTQVNNLENGGVSVTQVDTPQHQSQTQVTEEQQKLRKQQLQDNGYITFITGDGDNFTINPISGRKIEMISHDQYQQMMTESQQQFDQTFGVMQQHKSTWEDTYGVYEPAADEPAEPAPVPTNPDDPEPVPEPVIEPTTPDEPPTPDKPAAEEPITVEITADGMSHINLHTLGSFEPNKITADINPEFDPDTNATTLESGSLGNEPQSDFAGVSGGFQTSGLHGNLRGSEQQEAHTVNKDAFLNQLFGFDVENTAYATFVFLLSGLMGTTIPYMYKMMQENQMKYQLQGWQTNIYTNWGLAELRLPVNAETARVGLVTASQGNYFSQTVGGVADYQSKARMVPSAMAGVPVANRPWDKGGTTVRAGAQITRNLSDVILTALATGSGAAFSALTALYFIIGGMVGELIVNTVQLLRSGTTSALATSMVFNALDRTFGAKIYDTVAAILPDALNKDDTKALISGTVATAVYFQRTMPTGAQSDRELWRAHIARTVDQWEQNTGFKIDAVFDKSMLDVFDAFQPGISSMFKSRDAMISAIADVRTDMVYSSLNMLLAPAAEFMLGTNIEVRLQDEVTHVLPAFFKNLNLSVNRGLRPIEQFAALADAKILGFVVLDADNAEDDTDEPVNRNPFAGTDGPAVPIYGNYGGPGNKIIGPDKLGRPQVLAFDGSVINKPIDHLDSLFLQHDQGGVNAVSDKRLVDNIADAFEKGKISGTKAVIVARLAQFYFTEGQVQVRDLKDTMPDYKPFESKPTPDTEKKLHTLLAKHLVEKKTDGKSMMSELWNTLTGSIPSSSELTALSKVNVASHAVGIFGVVGSLFYRYALQVLRGKITGNRASASATSGAAGAAAAAAGVDYDAMESAMMESNAAEEETMREVLSYWGTD
jgi:hypothetical protein